MAPKSEDKKNRSPKKSVQRSAPQPNWTGPKTTEQTPLNKFIRRQADQGRSVSPELGDVAGFKDAERRGDIKPVRVGQGSKPSSSSSSVQSVRLRGDLAAQGVDTTPERSTKTPSKLSNVTRGGPVRTIRLGDPGAPTKRDAKILQRMTTASSEQTKALQRNLEKPKAVKQAEVSKRAARFRQSFGTPTGANPRTGAPTYKPLSAMTDLPKGRGGKAPSPRQYGNVRVGNLLDIQQVVVKDITPSRGASSSTKALPPARTTSPSVASTKTKVELPKLKLTKASAKPTQPRAPKPSFTVPGTTKQRTSPQLPSFGNTSAPKPTPSRSVSTTAGQNLKFDKTKTGSFSYKPTTKAPTTTAVPTQPAPTRRLEPSANPTIRRRSGDAGPSSKLDSKPPKRSVTTSKPPTSVDLGRPNQSRPRQDSVSYRPSTKTDKPPSTKAGPLSMFGDALYGGLVGYDAYQKAKQRGQSDAYAFKQAGVQGGSTAVASALGGATGRRIGAKFPGWTKALAIPAGDIIGSGVAGYLAQKGSPGIMGASKSDKKWMQWANRSVQQGTAAKNATSKVGTRAVVRDAQGKERVGYLAYKDGKPVYKHGNDPSSLQYTSSDPLERVGRTIGSSDIPFVSNVLKGYYSRKDDQTRRANVATQRSRAGN